MLEDINAGATYMDVMTSTPFLFWIERGLMIIARSYANFNEFITVGYL